MESAVKSEKMLKKQYCDERNIPVMLVKIKLPVISHPALKECAELYYGGVYAAFSSWCEKTLLEKAKHDIKDGICRPKGAVLNYTVSFENEEFISIYTDAFVFNGTDRGNTVRLSQVWSKKEGRICVFSDFFERSDKERIIKTVLEKANERNANGERRYKKNFGDIIESHFDFTSFYMTENGMAFCFSGGKLSDFGDPDVFVVEA